MAGTSLEAALVDESQQLPSQLATLAAALPEEQRAQMAGLQARLPPHGAPPAEHMLGLFAWAAAVVERCAEPGPAGDDVAIAHPISALPEVCLHNTLQYLTK